MADLADSHPRLVDHHEINDPVKGDQRCFAGSFSCSDHYIMISATMVGFIAEVYDNHDG